MLLDEVERLFFQSSKLNQLSELKQVQMLFNFQSFNKFKAYPTTTLRLKQFCQPCAHTTGVNV
jgi:hypothetical protein